MAVKEKEAKTERIEFRVTPEEKEMLQEAQRLSGDSSVSEFILRVLRLRIMKILAARQKVLASTEDSRIFFEAVMADLDPNEALKAAAQKHKSSRT